MKTLLIALALLTSVSASADVPNIYINNIYNNQDFPLGGISTLCTKKAGCISSSTSNPKRNIISYLSVNKGMEVGIIDFSGGFERIGEVSEIYEESLGGSGSRNSRKAQFKSAAIKLDAEVRLSSSSYGIPVFDFGYIGAKRISISKKGSSIELHGTIDHGEDYPSLNSKNYNANISRNIKTNGLSTVK